MLKHHKYMQRALELAKKGIGAVSPNPMVGCVLVHDEEIVGEGYHEIYGGPHAEVNAINSISNKELLKNCTMYVSLEPCSHYGKTPPCANLIIQHKIPKVVIALEDPNPKVAGNGIRLLKEAEIEVELGLLQKEAIQLNKRFLKKFNKKTPYIILKWAETADGYIARLNFDSKWISNEISRAWVHKWRAEEDAIMVGTNTVEYDNPTLNVRDWIGKNPTRLIVDRNLRLSGEKKVFDNTIPTILYHYENAIPKLPHQVQLGVNLSEERFLEDMFKDLYQKRISSVLVEGGATLLNALIQADLWDEARVFKSKNTFGNGINAPIVNGVLDSLNQIGDDVLMIYQNQNEK